MKLSHLGDGNEDNNSTERNIFERLESEVRSYCRSFPTVFAHANGAFLYNEKGERYIDFFSGAGALNYGHNNPIIKKAVISYLEQDGVVHGLDMWTVAKRTFLEKFEGTILRPRGMDYKIQFTGPTGANAVEAALKLARKVKRRSNVVAFTNAFHGLSLGALAVTGNRHFRDESFTVRLNVTFMPFDGYLGKDVDTLEYLRKCLRDNSSGMDLPAAVIVETLQAEGGVNVARIEWLKGLEKVCREFDMLLIVDDIQVGNGRTGTFFSFEIAGLHPDIVVMSKAISGLGLPMSLLLISPGLDQWKPGEHTGTFRGNNLAFVAATAALSYWDDTRFATEITRKEKILADSLEGIVRKHEKIQGRVRGRGLIYGLELEGQGLAKAVAREAFRRGLVIEVAGADDQVLKFLPPLTIEHDVLREGLAIIEQSIEAICYGTRGQLAH